MTAIPDLCFTRTGDNYVATTTIAEVVHLFTLSAIDYSLRVEYDGSDVTYTDGVVDMNSSTVRATFAAVVLAAGTYALSFLLDTTCCQTSSTSTSTSTSEGPPAECGASCAASGEVGTGTGVFAINVPAGGSCWQHWTTDQGPMPPFTYTFTAVGGSPVMTAYGTCGGAVVNTGNGFVLSPNISYYLFIDNTAGATPCTQLEVTQP